MIKFTALTIGIFLGFISCKKTSDFTELNYEIRDVKDFECSNMSCNISISVKRISGGPEDVVLSVSGLPPGMDGSIANFGGQKPDFAATILFVRNEKIPDGIYPLKIKGRTSKSGKVKEYDLYMTVIND